MGGKRGIDGISGKLFGRDDELRGGMRRFQGGVRELCHNFYEKTIDKTEAVC